MYYFSEYFYAIRRILLRKQVTGMIRAGFTMFIPSLIDLTNDDKKEKDKSKEYFVSYYLNDRPITIWFSYDGDISILEISAETFKALSGDEQANILMRILYEIYLGSNKYNASLNIKEVFDDNLIQNLLETFESGDTTYVVDLQKEEKELCRTRKKDK